LRDILDAHEWKREYERFMPLARFIYRPVSFWLTWAMTRIGVTTELASYLSGVAGVAAYLFLLSENHACLPTGIALLHVFNLLDCVDGNIARVTGTENPYGKFLDALIGDVINLLFFFIVGWMLYGNPDLRFCRNGDPLTVLILGTLTSLLFALLQHVESLYAHQVRQNRREHDRYTEKRINSEAAPIDDNQPVLHHGKRTSVLRVIDRNLRARETHYFFLLIGFMFHGVDIFLAIFFLFYLGRVLFSTMLFTKRVKSMKA
jgi:phosphatidylglycerophosphate synthase